MPRALADAGVAGVQAVVSSPNSRVAVPALTSGPAAPHEARRRSSSHVAALNDVRRRRSLLRLFFFADPVAHSRAFVFRVFVLMIVVLLLSVASGLVWVFPNNTSGWPVASLDWTTFPAAPVPAAVALVASADDVKAVLSSKPGKLCVRSGRHAYTLFSLCENGTVIDVSLINGLEMRPGGVARVGAGTRNWSAGLAAAWENRVWVGGTCPTVGAGFALGGGYSLVSRAFGMACDNMVAAEIVLASGDVVLANATNSFADLFWALRGAGAGNFGVVTHLSYALPSPVPGVVATWSFTWKASDALDSLVAWEAFLMSVFDDRRVTPLLVVTATGETRWSGLFLGPQTALQQLLEPWLSVAPVPATSQFKEMSWLESVALFDGCSSIEVRFSVF